MSDHRLSGQRARIGGTDDQGLNTFVPVTSTTACTGSLSLRSAREHAHLLLLHAPRMWEPALATFVVARGVCVKSFLAGSRPITADDRSLEFYVHPEDQDVCVLAPSANFPFCKAGDAAGETVLDS